MTPKTRFNTAYFFIAEATDIARNMATRYGMADPLGHAVKELFAPVRGV